jgi:hypothetical protein
MGHVQAREGLQESAYPHRPAQLVVELTSPVLVQAHQTTSNAAPRLAVAVAETVAGPANALAQLCLICAPVPLVSNAARHPAAEVGIHLSVARSVAPKSSTAD